MPDDSLPPSFESSASDAAQALATIAPVARQSVVDAVAARLRGDILAGRLRPGTRLPSERELSLALGVNRLTLRASLARLEALGLIATKHGAGTVVASWRERAGLETLGTLVRGLKVADPAWHDLVRSTLEIRRILAAEAVALAAERHTEDDLGAIAACAQVVLEHADDPIAFARADLAFMRAVCKAAHNVGLELFLNTFARWPDDHPLLVAMLYDDCASASLLYSSIVDLIRSRDRELARGLARRALEELDEAWARRHPAPVAVAVAAVAAGGARDPAPRGGGARDPALERRGLARRDAMKLSGIESGWAMAALSAMFPGSPETGLEGIAAMDVSGYLDDVMRTRPFRAVLGLRVAVWLVALAPPFVLGRVATIVGLAHPERERLLDGLLAHRTYSVRM